LGFFTRDIESNLIGFDSIGKRIKFYPKCVALNWWTTVPDLTRTPGVSCWMNYSF
jgi:hypothetical protein